MVRKSIAIAVVGSPLVLTLAYSAKIGFFPGLDELIAKADAIVVLRVDKQVTHFAGDTLSSTQDYYIYRTLKGDILANKTIGLELADTRISFVTPYTIHSTHLMFFGQEANGK